MPVVIMGAGTSLALSRASLAQAIADKEPTILSIPIRTFELVQFSLLAGAMAAALASAFWLIRERGRIASQNAALRGKVASLTSNLNQLEALSTAEGQRAVIWSGQDQKPTVIGTLETGTGAPENRAEFLAFGRWLEPRSAARLDHSVASLRDLAKPFFDVVETSRGVPVEVTGRTSGGSAILRFANLAQERADHARLISAHEKVVNTLETFQTLMDRVDMPIWLRDRDGALTWVNRYFAGSVDCEDSAQTIAKKAELFGTQARRTIADQCADGTHFAEAISTVIAGDRVMFDVIEANGPFGTAGLGIDKSETEAVRHELNKTIHSHEETLDQLTTAVAMFDERSRLVFHNQSFQKLWELETSFLEQNPDMGMFLDRLRTQGKLPEQPEWRRWKDEILGAFKSIEPQEHWWHLPDGRTVRVIANPHPKGGLTWVFENLTERIDLESRYKTMVKVQGETLDHLAEGVVVFGSDGLLQLANPAFERFWSLDAVMKSERVHISQIAAAIKAAGDDPAIWEQFAGIVTAFDEDRTDDTGRVTRGTTTLSWMVVPLPNGQTMITFVDMTAAEQIERALRDRNDALERTARLKNRFIQHVSYELRSPLTSIMGFTDLIAMEKIGPLNEKQREYVSHVEASSRALLETTDDILDLASIDAGVMELSLDTVEIAPVMNEAAALLAERFAEHSIDLAVRIAPDAGSIVADRERMLQVMVNVLTNAADFAPEQTTVSFTCERKDDHVTFTVRDRGPGIPESALKDVFERFHTEQAGRRRGAGLGLAIVKSFVTLHDGEVVINSSESRGTEVVITFPQAPARVQVAAE